MIPAPQVLFILLSGEFDEDERLSCEDIFELNTRGVEWRALCLSGSPIYNSLIQLGKSRIIAMDHVPRSILDQSIKKVLDEQIAIGTNVVHVFKSDYLGSILPWMGRDLNIPLIVSEGRNVRKQWRHWFQSWFYWRIDALLVPTLSLKRRIQDMRPSLEKITHVLNPGLDLNIFNPDHFDFTVLRKRWGIDSESYLVGMIASNEYIKSQGAFIKAAASFLRNEELAQRTKFVIVGFEDSGSEDLIELIKQFHLQDHIILVPEEDSIPKVLGTLDVFVMPSSKAIFGLQAIESLAMGTPIICASGADAVEWIGDSQSGLLMRSGDSFDLQRKLRAMLEDPQELKVMGKRAVTYAREQYDRNKRTDRILDFYNHVQRRRRRIRQLKANSER